jgi:hypothetical protein
MLKCTLTIAAVTAALGLCLATASTAEAAGPWGRIAANGTQINGVALEGLTVEGIELRKVGVVMKEDESVIEEDDWDDAFGRAGCPRWVCGENGTQLNGVVLQGVTVEGIKPQRVDVVIPKSGKQEPKK